MIIVAGYYIDRQIIKNKNSIEDLTLEELEQRMEKIVEDNILITSHEKEGKNGKAKPKRNGLQKKQ